MSKTRPWSPLLRWLTRYFVLFLVVLVLLAIVLLNGLGGLGLPALFWGTESLAKELFIGVAIAVFFAVCALVGFLLDWGDEPVEDIDRTMRWYFVLTFVPLTLIVSLSLFIRWMRGLGYARDWGLSLGCVLGGVLIWFGSRVFRKPATRLANSHWFSTWIKAVAQKWRKQPVPDPNIWYHAYTALVLVTLLVFYALAAFVFIDSAALPAAVAIIIILLLIALGYGMLRFFFPHASVFVIIAIVVLAFFTNSMAYKHRVVGVGDYDKPAPIDHRVSPGHRVLPGDALTAWAANVGTFDAGCPPPAAGKPRVVIMMTSGGGIRAGVWMAAVMRELDRRYCGFSYHTKLITGASGGLVGAAYYLAHELPDPASAAGAAKVTESPLIATDSLSPVARYLALRDGPGLFWPGPFKDRGRALEEAWIANAPGMGEPVRTFATGEKAGWRPSIVFSPMMAEDGRQLLISNLVLDDVLKRPARRLDVDDQVLSRPSVQFFNVYPESNISMATAARMAASFPWVSPASELPSKPGRRTVDAGYFDNFGGYVAAAWLRAHIGQLRQIASGVLVVQVRDDVSDEENRELARAKPSVAERAFSELVAPLAAVLKTRNPAMNYHNDFDLAEFMTTDGFVSTVIVELPEGTAPLSWNLTSRETKDIVNAAASSKAIQSIGTWWRGPGG